MNIIEANTNYTYDIEELIAKWQEYETKMNINRQICTENQNNIECELVDLDSLITNFEYKSVWSYVEKLFKNCKFHA